MNCVGKFANVVHVLAYGVRWRRAAVFWAGSGYPTISQGLEINPTMHSDESVNDPRTDVLSKTTTATRVVSNNDDHTDRSLFVSILIFLAFLTPFLVWFFAVNPS